MKKHGRSEFALYKGEDLIEIGTIEELAELLNVKKETIKFYGYKSYMKRAKKGNRKVLVKLD